MTIFHRLPTGIKLQEKSALPVNRAIIWTLFYPLWYGDISDNTLGISLYHGANCTEDFGLLIDEWILATKSPHSCILWNSLESKIFTMFWYNNSMDMKGKCWSNNLERFAKLFVGTRCRYMARYDFENHIQIIKLVYLVSSAKIVFYEMSDAAKWKKIIYSKNCWWLCKLGMSVLYTEYMFSDHY